MAPRQTRKGSTLTFAILMADLIQRIFEHQSVLLASYLFQIQQGLCYINLTATVKHGQQYDPSVEKGHGRQL